MSPVAWLLVGFWIGFFCAYGAQWVVAKSADAEEWGRHLDDGVDESFQSDVYDFELEARRVAPNVTVRRARR